MIAVGSNTSRRLVAASARKDMRVSTAAGAARRRGMTDTGMADCGWCDERVAIKDAAVVHRQDEVIFLHHETESPTCYERWQWAQVFRHPLLRGLGVDQGGNLNDGSDD